MRALGFISDPTAALGSALRLHVATQQLQESDIVETRVLVESWAVTRAPSNAPEFTEAKMIHHRMSTFEKPASEFLAMDIQFHRTLADAAGDSVVSAPMDSLRESIERFTVEPAENLPHSAATADRLHIEHRSIPIALLDQHSGPAAQLVTDHIQGYYRMPAPTVGIFL